MAYQINKTDGTVVATVADGQIDTLSTDITLIGKNYSGFGESLNENLVKILENFSSTSAPDHPIIGQLWFDTSELKLKVYNGASYIPVSSATISNIRPSTLAIGDLWFNNVERQLYFFDGTNPILLGPAYSSTQGLSGIKVDSILDTLNQTRIITYFYNNGILLGIFSKDSFTPKTDIIGYSGSISPGFNAGTLAGIKFDVTCTNSERLGGEVATTYVRRDLSNALTGQLRITTDLGLVVGSAGQANLYVSGGDVFLSNAATDKRLVLNVRKGIDQEDAVLIDASSRTINLYNGFLNSSVFTGGNLIVGGNLTVEGSTTTINTENLTVEDKNIVIANIENPTDEYANGAGITIKGNTDKTILFSSDFNRFDVSHSINLDEGSQIQIGGVEIVNGSSLGLAITSIPGVTSFGKLAVVNVGPGDANAPALLRLENRRISTVSSNSDIELEPDGTGNVSLLGNPRITGLADPINEQDSANKEYVDKRVEARSLVFSMDLSDGKSNAYIRENILNNIAPPVEFRNGTIVRILCTLISNAASLLDINGLPPAVSKSAFLIDTIGNTAPAMTNISFPTAIIPGSSVSTTRIIKQFTLIAGIWTHQSDSPLPS
jgi:hypothetical protein